MAAVYDHIASSLRRPGPDPGPSFSFRTGPEEAGPRLGGRGDEEAWVGWAGHRVDLRGPIHRATPIPADHLFLSGDMDRSFEF
ncbi:MAG: hypothetical protein ACR2PC_14160 [Tsuneonella suprasediminis]|uniref:hypothetical protein n=1 Tax=Tsuneonella suprasediminis TaxID=2306996 RepID=UPI000E75E8BE|nr:hypothetical protein [Tsuneonella suprasediminis]UBS31677.1 hypothetical protein LBX01_09150 [Altererythrobacter sp. N1]